MSHDEREKLTKRVTFFGGKAAPGYALAKNVIKLVNVIANKVNNDEDVNKYYKIVFLPDYKVSSTQRYFPKYFNCWYGSFRYILNEIHYDWFNYFRYSLWC